MKNPKLSLALLRLAVVLSIVIAFIIGWTVLRQDPTEEADQAREPLQSVKRTDSTEPAPANPGLHSKRPEDATRATVTHLHRKHLFESTELAGPAADSGDGEFLVERRNSGGNRRCNDPVTACFGKPVPAGQGAINRAYDFSTRPNTCRSLLLPVSADQGGLC